MVGGSSFDQDKNKLAEYETSSTSSSGVSATCFNTKTGEVLGRGLCSWLKLFSFFLLFSSMIAVLFGLCIGIFFQTVSSDVPKLILEDSVIGANPGLGYRPAGGLGFQTKGGDYKGYSVYSSLIWFRHGGDGNFGRLRENLDRFLEEYEPGYHPSQGSTLTKCNFETKRKPDESCEFDKEDLSNDGADIKCISAEHYGYYYGKPCILLKLNRIYNWEADPYNIHEVRNHTTMPLALKNDIEKIYADKCGDDDAHCDYLNMVWLHCDGEDDPDKENLGEVTYTPSRGFPGYYFPYRKQRGYLSPLVMVQLKNPTPAVLMNLQCTAWARNIKHNRMKKNGYVHFELLMD
jgi:sodium/potassium-transporting ATPase subunit beta